MPIPEIGREIITLSVSSTYTLKDPNVGQVICDCTSAGFTLTIYNDSNSGSYHRLVVSIASTDVSGNTLTIVDAAGNFSTTLASTSASVELETTNSGAWIIAAAYPTLDANTAISAADSAGLASSEAFSEADSAGLAASASTSGVTTLTTTVSTNKSIAASATLSGTSAAESIAASAVLSGVSATASVAGSSNLSQSLLISGADSANTSQSLLISGSYSQNESQSLNVSTALSVAVS